MGAGAGNLDHGEPRRESISTRRLIQLRGNGRRGNFADLPAAVADQKGDGGCIVVTMGAGDEGIPAFDAMNKTIVDEEIEHAIDGDRRGSGAVARQQLDDFIGAESTVLLQHCLQHVTALRGEFLAPGAAHRFGVVQRIRGAKTVIVVGMREHGLRRRHRPFM